MILYWYRRYGTPPCFLCMGYGEYQVPIFSAAIGKTIASHLQWGENICGWSGTDKANSFTQADVMAGEFHGSCFRRQSIVASGDVEEWRRWRPPPDGAFSVPQRTWKWKLSVQPRQTVINTMVVLLFSLCDAITKMHGRCSCYGLVDQCHI